MPRRVESTSRGREFICRLIFQKPEQVGEYDFRNVHWTRDVVVRCDYAPLDPSDFVKHLMGIEYIGTKG